MSRIKYPKLPKALEAELYHKLAIAYRNQYLGSGIYRGMPGDTLEHVETVNKQGLVQFRRGLEQVQEISDALKPYGMYIDTGSLLFSKEIHFN